MEQRVEKKLIHLAKLAPFYGQLLQIKEASELREKMKELDVVAGRRAYAQFQDELAVSGDDDLREGIISVIQWDLRWWFSEMMEMLRLIDANQWDIKSGEIAAAVNALLNMAWSFKNSEATGWNIQRSIEFLAVLADEVLTRKYLAAECPVCVSPEQVAASGLSMAGECDLAYRLGATEAAVRKVEKTQV